MQKLKMHSKNPSKENIEKIYELFPNCVTEAKDESGSIVRKIDFDSLRQELSESIVEGPQERYQLNWPGKRNALLAANAPIAKTLRPCREESVNFDTTKNIFIEGDNLDALKLLQETYLGKVKMIYIDPPYNTGNDFIYKDDFSENTQEYLKRSSQKDENGNRLVANNESNGRFHSDWLSMIYPRLKISRNLLSNDGVIFISIDDSELSNLKCICDEIYGALNYLCTFVWKRRSGAMDSINNVSSDHEYVLCYGKENSKLNGISRTFENYSNLDNDPRGPWIADNLSAGKPGGNTYYPIIDSATGNEYWPPKGRYWPYSPETMSKKIDEGRILFPKNKNGAPLLKRFKNEAKSDVIPVSTWGGDKKSSNALLTSLNTEGTKEIKSIFGNKIFLFPKPTQLLKSLMLQACKSDSIVLDFFVGSGTLCDAMMQLNAHDGGNRKFIAVQLPEPCEPKSEPFNEGYRTIAEISMERIRRVGKRILEGKCHDDWKKDIGFRVLKIDTSNLKDVYYYPDNLQQADLFSQIDNIKENRTPEDLLFQVLLDWGIDLTLPINMKNINNKQIFFVDENALIACFDTGVDDKTIKEIANYKPLRVVFRDSAFVSDATKINAEQLFKQISPSTDIRTI